MFFFKATFEVLKHNSYSYCYSDFTSINRIYLLNFYPVTRCYVPCEQWFLVAQETTARRVVTALLRLVTLHRRSTNVKCCVSGVHVY